MEKKLSLYSKIKHKFAIEPYTNLPFRDRQIISKMVGSTHKLQVEIGRHHEIPREKRVCKLCNLNKVEDEDHFITECPAYADIRSEYYGPESPSAKEMFLVIEPATMASFLRKIYSKRDEILEQQKTVYHAVKISATKLSIIKGPKRCLMAQNICKDGLKLKIFINLLKHKTMLSKQYQDILIELHDQNKF